MNNRRSLAALGILVVVCLAAGALRLQKNGWAAIVEPTPTPQVDRVTGARLVVDPGHGGHDPGAIGAQGITEAQLNLDVSLRIEKMLRDRQAQVRMTRDDEAVVLAEHGQTLKMRDMIHRVALSDAFAPAALVSVHMNANDDARVRGAQVFYRAGDEPSRALAQAIEHELAAVDPNTRGHTTGDFYMLNEPACPAVLVECGFLTNPQDEALLLDDAYRDTIAQAVVAGICKWLQETVQ